MHGGFKQRNNAGFSFKLGQFQWDKDDLRGIFGYHFFRQAPYFWPEVKPIQCWSWWRPSTKIHQVMLCHATSHREKKTWIHPQSRSVLLIGWSMKKKQSVISNCLTHYNASYNPNYYPKSQSFPICYTFWSLPLPQSMRSRRVRFFFTVLSCHGDSTGGWSRLSWCFFFLIILWFGFILTPRNRWFMIFHDGFILKIWTVVGQHHLYPILGPFQIRSIEMLKHQRLMIEKNTVYL